MSDLESIGDGRFLRLVRRGRWEFVQRRNASGVVAVVAVTNDDELLLVEQFRPAVSGRVIELPAGLAGDIQGQEDEHGRVAAERELVEETGWEAGQCDELLSCYPSPGLTDEQITFFLARQLRKVGPGGGVDGEDIVTHPVPLAEVDAWLASQLAAGKHLSALVPCGLHLYRSASA